MMNVRKLVIAVVALALIAGALSMPAMAQEKTDIKVWIAFTDVRLDWSRERAAEFNAQFPQFNVTVDGYASYEEIQQATDLAIQQNNPPAIVQWFEVGTQRARDFGYFKSIADALEGRTEVNGVPVNFDDFIAPVVDYYTLDGKFTSMPWNSSSPTLYTNVAMMKELGLEKPPATWQELEAACAKALEMKAQLGIDGCVTWPNHGWFVEQWMAQRNALYVNNGNGRDARATETFLDSEDMIAIISWWQKMYQNGYYIYSGRQRDWNATEQAIQSGKVPFVITSSADTANITNAAKANGIDILTSRMPYDADKGWTGNLIGGASLWLVDGLPAKMEEGALTFLLWFTNTENIAEWHKVTGYLPLRNSSVELLEKEGWFKTNPNFLTAVEQIRQTTVTPATRGALLGTFPQTRNIVTRVMEELMLQGGDPAAAMKAAKAEADKLLKEYNALYE